MRVVGDRDQFGRRDRWSEIDNRAPWRVLQRPDLFAVEQDVNRRYRGTGLECDVLRSGDEAEEEGEENELRRHCAPILLPGNAHNRDMYLLIRWLVNTLALFVVVELVPGFHY